MKKLLQIVAIVLFLSLIPISPVLAASDSMTSPSISATAIPTSDEVTSLRNELEQYRNENYQNAIDSGKAASDKANQLIGFVSMIATVFGVAFGAFAIFFGLNLETNRREVRELVGEMRSLASTAKLKAEEITKYVDDSKRIVDDVVPKLVKELEENSKAKEQIFAELQKAQKTGKDLESLKQKMTLADNNTVDLARQLLQAVNNLQSNRFQATTVSGTLSQQSLIVNAPNTTPDFLKAYGSASPNDGIVSPFSGHGIVTVTGPVDPNPKK